MDTQKEKMSGFYRFHARIYEATRWTFLFGRHKVIQLLQLPKSTQQHTLEIGCGTGHNMVKMAKKYPHLKLTGVDISPEMLAVAQKLTAPYPNNIELLELPYGQEALPEHVPPPDLVLISYCMTMVNPGFEKIIAAAASDLTIGGRIAVVDFHTSRFNWFRRWMAWNHVRIEGQLLPELERNFQPIFQKILPAYGGLWHYFIFIGEKK